MNAKQPPVVPAEKEAQQPMVTGDSPPRAASHGSATDSIIQSLLLALFFSQANAGHLRHPIDRGDGNRVDNLEKIDSESLAGGHSTLLHGHRRKSRTQHIA